MEGFSFDKSRIFSFNDAIFSIAITLLILEIDIPDFDVVSQLGTWHALEQLLPSFIGFLVSFMVIALYWQSHLKLSKFIVAYDRRLLWLNIYLLLFVVLLPFSTAFYVTDYSLEIPGPFVFYCANLIGLGLFNFLMLRRALKQSKSSVNSHHARYAKARSLCVVFIWILSLLMVFVWPGIARFFFISLFIVLPLLDRRYRKKRLLRQEELVAN